jgi:hypothetical protein
MARSKVFCVVNDGLNWLPISSVRAAQLRPYAPSSQERIIVVTRAYTDSFQYPR